MTSRAPEWNEILADEALPAAVVDRAAFDRNVATVARIARPSGKRMRVATKSLRSVWAIRRAAEGLGDLFGGLMTLTCAEAAFLADRGFDDLLVAYPTLRRRDIETLADLTARGVTARIVVDDEAHLRALSEVGRDRGATIAAVVEIDMAWRPLPALHLGVRRSPIRDAAAVIRLARLAQQLGGVRVDGLMGYEAQIAGMGEANPFSPALNPVRRLIKSGSIPDVTKRRAAVARELRTAGVDIRIVNGGGTGSLATTGADAAVTELTAGSAFFAPHLFDYYARSPYEPAAFFALQVVRHPAPGVIACQGGGYVASGEAGPDRLPIPWNPEGLALIGMEGAGETQTPLLLPKGMTPPPLGSVVLFRHAKAGELCERFNELLIVEDGRVVERAPTYRGEGLAAL